MRQGASICGSIRERTRAGLGDMAGMRRTMVFRNEAEQSTGAPSVGVIGPAFNNLPNRAGEGYRTMLVLDEPELGRSEGYTRARGTRPGGQITVMPQKTVSW